MAYYLEFFLFVESSYCLFESKCIKRTGIREKKDSNSLLEEEKQGKIRDEKRASV